MLLIAAALVLTAAVVSFLPPVRSWLLSRLAPSHARLVPLSGLGRDGVPLGTVWLRPDGDGYPAGDGKALFWVRCRAGGGDNLEWLLLRLPDRRVLARAYGFSSIRWLAGGKAFAVTAAVNPLSRLPVLWRFVDHFTLGCWTLDWRNGGIRAVDLRDIPASDRPVLHNWRCAPGTANVGFGYSGIGVAVPPVPEAHQAGPYTLRSRFVPTYATLIYLADLKGSDVKTLCRFGGTWGAASLCMTSADTAIALVPNDPGARPYPCGVYRLTVSTGRLENIPLESTDAAAARP